MDLQIVPFTALQLASTEEYIGGQFTGNLGEVLIRQVPSILKRRLHLIAMKRIEKYVCRCNNVLYMRGVPEEAMDAS